MQETVPDTGTETSANEGYRLEEQVGHILRLVSQRHAAIFQASAVMGLTPTQFAALIRLDEMGECSQNRLGRNTAMDVATIKGVVDRLNRKGFVTLRRDDKDKRRTMISLTPAAKARVSELKDIGTKISQETLKPLSASEQRSFLRLLRKVT